jgi:Inhibitor of the KinA pathway to sporulation, predicted exonuclease
MKKIFIDLEMTPIERVGLPSGCSIKSEVIEIGAVALDEADREISCFDEYVRPVHTDHVADVITDLTGIRTEQVAQAAPFSEVFPRFLEWCGPDCTFYFWSDCDLKQLKRECEDKHIDPAGRFSSWQDFQKVYVRKFGYERRMSLKNAITLAGLDFEGRPHGALADAANTAALFRHTGRQGFKKLTAMVTENRSPLTFSLGSLIDLAGLAV